MDDGFDSATEMSSTLRAATVTLGPREHARATPLRRVVPRSWTACVPQSNFGMTRAQTVSIRAGPHSPPQVATMQMW